MVEPVATVEVDTEQQQVNAEFFGLKQFQVTG